MSTSHHIKAFEHYFLSYLQDIESSTIHQRYKKLALMNLLDGMSKVLNDQYQSNDHSNDTSKRFFLLMHYFSGSAWDHADDVNRVCLIHLDKALLMNENKERFEHLRHDIQKKLDYFYTYLDDKQFLKLLPFQKHIKALWPLNNMDSYLPIIIGDEEYFPWHMTIDALFYSYRNILVHGVEPTIFGLNYQDEHSYDHPYYQRDQESIFLKFPLPFCINFCKVCLEQLVIYLNKLNLDPFDFYKKDLRTQGYFMSFL
jgi:hypothetical protein